MWLSTNMSEIDYLFVWIFHYRKANPTCFGNNSTTKPHFLFVEYSFFHTYLVRSFLCSEDIFTKHILNILNFFLKQSFG